MKLPAGFPVQKDVPPPVSLCIQVPPEHLAEAARIVAGMNNSPVEVPWIPTLHALQDFLLRVHDLEVETLPHMTTRMFCDASLDNPVDMVSINDSGVVCASSSLNPEQSTRVLSLVAYLWDGPSANITNQERANLD